MNFMKKWTKPKWASEVGAAVIIPKQPTIVAVKHTMTILPLTIKGSVGVL